MELLTSQKADIFEAITSSGLAPSSFKWILTPSIFHGDPVPCIKYAGTKFSFTFDSERGQRMCHFSPSEDRLHGRIGANHWLEVTYFFNNWLGYLKREVSTIDPWENLSRQTISFNAHPDANTPATPFTVTEFAAVQRTLNVVKALLITYAKDDGEKLDAIREGIANLEKAAESQDRKSWFQLVVGFLAGTAVNMALAPDQTKVIFEALKTGLAGTIVLISQ